jgi:ABC-type sugar transport system ATPase subunit
VWIGANSTLELERDQMTKLDEAGLKEVTAGIRAEQLELSDSGGIEGVVDLVEDLNSEAYLYTHAGSVYTPAPSRAGPARESSTPTRQTTKTSASTNHPSPATPASPHDKRLPDPAHRRL